MSMLPYFTLWLLLLVAAVLALLVGGRGRLAGLIGPLATLAAASVWWLARPDGPVNATWAGWQWLVDDAAWQLSGLALLLAFAASLAAFLADWSQPDPDAARSQQAGAAVLALVTGLLPLLWAGDGRTLVAGYGLMLVIWLAVVHWQTSAHDRGHVNHVTRGSVLVAGLLFVWLAFSLSGTLGSGAWAPGALLVAGVVACGVFPAGSWRAAAITGQPATGVMLLSVPMLAGARLLWPLAQPGSLSGSLLAVGSALGLVAVLWAIGSLFSTEMGARALALSMSGALGGLLLLAALWAGPEGLLAQTRVAVLVPAMLLLITQGEAGDPVARATGSADRSWLWASVPALGLAVAAVAALPLTAGFLGLGGIYEAWLAVGGWPLVSVAAVLMSLLIAGLVSRSWNVLRRGLLSGNRRAWLNPSPAWLLALGLVALPMGPLSSTSAFTWATILLPVVVGLALAYLFITRLQISDVASAIVPSLPEGWRDGAVARAGRRAGELAGEATADALAILEGPYGLLWIVALLVLFIALA